LTERIGDLCGFCRFSLLPVSRTRKTFEGMGVWSHITCV
jgi:hypothetical protein